ncbi:MAG: hypothetical protein J6A52_00880 [Bacilli bacterium]|nr:hypothetical protein [Bacilli bacterium]
MIILGLVSIVLDLIILNVSPYTINNITSLFPMLTFVYIISMFYFSKKVDITYYVIIFLYLLIGNNIFLPLMGLILLHYLITKYKAYFKINIFSYLLLVTLSIAIFDIFTFFILVLFNSLQFNIYYLSYKIINSIILNISYGILLYFLFPVLTSNKN